MANRWNQTDSVEGQHVIRDLQAAMAQLGMTPCNWEFSVYYNGHRFAQYVAVIRADTDKLRIQIFVDHILYHPVDGIVSLDPWVISWRKKKNDNNDA